MDVGRHGGARGVQAPAVARKTDAGARGDAVVAAGGRLNSKRRGRGALALAALAALGQRQQRVLVAGRVAGSLDGQVRVAGAVTGRRGRLLDGEGARRRVDGIPQARGRRSRRPVVQGAQVQAEDAVRQRPAGRHGRRFGRRRRSGGGAWRRRDGGQRGGEGGEGGEESRGGCDWSMHAEYRPRLQSERVSGVWCSLAAMDVQV